MATIRKRNGKYHTQIRRKGFKPLTKSFSSKSSALTWARKTEATMESGEYLDYSEAQKTTLTELMDRYKSEILSTKRSQNSVRSQIKIIGAELGNLSTTSITPSTLSKLRDKRLRAVSAETVRKDLSFLQRLFNTAMKDWGINLPHGNPVNQVRFPSPPPGRDKRPTIEELKLLYADSIVGNLVEFAVETGMRRGEISAMKWEHIDWCNHTLAIPNTKTEKPRRIPLSEAARGALSRLPRTPGDLPLPVWDKRSDSITQAFSRACKKNKISNLRFHDLRHEATSRFFEKGLNMMEVASITGHQDLRMLRRYTHIRAETLVEKL